MLDKVFALGAALTGAAAVTVPLQDAPALETENAQLVSRALDDGMVLPERKLLFTEVDVDGLMGAVVIDTERAYVGRVGQLMVSGNGQIQGAVLNVEHRLPIEPKAVAVSVDDLDVHVVKGDYVVQTRESREELSQSPEFEPGYTGARS